MKLLRQQNHEGAFQSIIAGSGWSTADRALKAFVLQYKAQIAPSPTKRIIHLLSLPISVMWPAVLIKLK